MVVLTLWGVDEIEEYDINLSAFGNQVIFETYTEGLLDEHFHGFDAAGMGN